jgi:flagellar protein FlgJ
MISNGIDPQLVAKSVDTQELVRFKSEMDGLKKRMSGDGADEQAQLKKACTNFEAVFIGKLWQQMKSTVPKEGYLHSKQEDNYMAMFDRDFSEKMAQAGGIGLADMIYGQLSEKLKETSKTALTGKVDIRPLAPQPIAMNQGMGGIALPDKNEGMTLEEWGGAAAIGSDEKNQASPGMTSEDIVSGLLGNGRVRQPMTDIDVKAKLEDLTRRLESERIHAGLIGNGGMEKIGKYENETDGDGEVGRKLAEIG